MTTEAKVGAFTVVGVVLFVAVAMLLSSVSLSGHKGYTLYAGFKQVIGVEPESVVRLSGVPVGKVKSVRNDGGGVTVALDIDGKAKMSKSRGNCIYLADEPEDIRTKVMGMFTDPNHLQVSDPGQTEGNPVFMYLDAFCCDEYFAKYLPDYANLDELKAHYRRGGLGDVKVKKFLNNVLQETLEPIRTRRKELEKDPGYVMDVLRQGTEVAQAAAAETLAKVKHAMQIDYFA